MNSPARTYARRIAAGRDAPLVESIVEEAMREARRPLLDFVAAYDAWLNSGELCCGGDLFEAMCEARDALEKHT